MSTVLCFLLFSKRDFLFCRPPKYEEVVDAGNNTVSFEATEDGEDDAPLAQHQDVIQEQPPPAYTSLSFEQSEDEETSLEAVEMPENPDLSPRA